MKFVRYNEGVMRLLIDDQTVDIGADPLARLLLGGARRLSCN